MQWQLDFWTSDFSYFKNVSKFIILIRLWEDSNPGPVIGDVANSRRPQRLRVDFQLRVRTNAKTWVRVKMKVHAKVRGYAINTQKQTYFSRIGMTFSSRAMKLCLVLLCSREVKLFYIVFDIKFTKSVFQKYFTPNFLFFISVKTAPKQVLGALWMWEVIHITIFFIQS